MNQTAARVLLIAVLASAGAVLASPPVPRAGEQPAAAPSLPQPAAVGWLPVSLSTTASEPAVKRIMTGPSGTVWLLGDESLYDLTKGVVQRSASGLSGRIDDIDVSASGTFFAGAAGLFFLDELRASKLAVRLASSPATWVNVGPSKVWYGDKGSEILSIDLDRHGRPTLDAEGRFIGGENKTSAPWIARVRRVIAEGPPGLLVLDDKYRAQFVATNPALQTAAGPLITEPGELFRASAHSSTVGAILTNRRVIVVSDTNSATTPDNHEFADGIALAAGRHGRFWVLGRDVIYALDPATGRRERPTRLPTRVAPLEPLAVAEDSSRRLWLGTSAGLFVTGSSPNEARALDYQDRQDVAGSTASVPRNPVGVDREGDLWLAGTDKLVPIGGDDRRPCPLPPHVASASFTPSVVVAVPGGLARVDGCETKPGISVPRTLDRQQLAKLDRADALLRDLEGSPAIMERLEEAARKTGASLRSIEFGDRLEALLLDLFNTPELKRQLLEAVESLVTPMEIAAQSESSVVTKIGSSLAFIDLRHGSFQEIRLLPTLAQVNSAASPGSRATVFAADANGVVIEINGTRSISPIALPAGSGFSAPNFSAPKAWQVRAPPDGLDAFLMNSERILRLSPGATPQTGLTADASPPLDAVVTSLLSDGRGGALVGVAQLGGPRRFGELLYLRTTNEVTPVVSNGLEVTVANVRNSNGTILAAGDGALVLIDPERRTVSRTPVNSAISALVECPRQSGRVWAALEDRRLWRVDRPLSEAQPTNVPLQSLICGPVSPGRAEALWGGGRRRLLAFDATTGKSIADHSKAIASIGEFSVNSMILDGTEVLLGGHEGIASFDTVTLLARPIRTFDTVREGFGRTGFVRLDDDEVLAYSPQDTGSVLGERTTVWTLKNGAVTRTRTLEVEVFSAASDTPGRVLLGTTTGEVIRYSADGTAAAVRVTAPRQDKWSRYDSICPLNGDNLLFYGDGALGHVLWKQPPAGTQLRATTQRGAELKPRVIRSSVAIGAWTQCAPLSSSQAVLVASAQPATLVSVKGQWADVTPLACETGVACPGSFEQIAFHSDLPGKAWLLGDRTVWLFDGQPVIRPIARLETFVQGVTSLAVDKDGIWVGTDKFGLHRWTGNPTTGNLKDVAWKTYETDDGLPAMSIRHVASRSETSVLVITTLGVIGGTYDNTRRWTFKTERGGVSGLDVNGVALWEGTPAHGVKDDGVVVAVLTDQGLNVGSTSREAGGLFRPLSWTQSSQGALESRGQPRALAVCPTDGELLVGVGSRIEGFRLDTSAATPIITRSDWSSPSFPTSIVDLRISPDCSNVWVLHTTASQSMVSRNDPGAAGKKMVSRWRRTGSGAAVHTTIPAFSPGGTVWLGTPIGMKPPPITYRDAALKYSVWDLNALDEPQLEIADVAGLWIKPRIDPAGVSGDAAFKTATADFAVDRGHGLSGPRRFAFAPDLFRPGPYLVVATVRDEATDREWTVVNRRELRFDLWLIRFALVVGSGVAVMFFSGRSVAREVVRRRRLRANEIPYVAGKVVEGGQFFGRVDLLRRLRDGIAVNSYALVGEWRIGKSSIQKRLAHTLTTMQSEGHVYLPVWVDLQHLFGRPTAAEVGFFRFLGQRLLDESKSVSSPEVAAQLFLATPTNPETYGSSQLEADLGVLQSYWRQRFAPKSPVIVFQIDEAGLMSNFAYETLLAFRAIFVNVQGVHTILSGKRLPENKTGDYFSPWLNFLEANIIEVGPLTYDEAKQLVVEPARRLFIFEEPAIQQIVALAEGKPMAIQGLCAAVLNYKYHRGHLRRRISKADVESARAWIRQSKKADPLQHSEENRSAPADGNA